MSTTNTEIELLPSLNSGMFDEFGNGSVINSQPAMFALPVAFASMQQDGWYITQWGQPQPVNVNDYLVNSPTTHDDLYGNALYSWSQPGQTSAIALYQNTAPVGGGDVIQITDGSTNTAPQGMTDEADMFLQGPNVSANYSSLAHPITVSLDAKIVQSITDFESASDAAKYATGGAVFSTMNVAFYIQYNGAGNLPAYGGFVQIDPWESNTTQNVLYESDNISPTQTSPSAFVSSLLLGQGTGLPMLAADAYAQPDTLTYNINQYAYDTILSNFSSFSAAQKVNLLNLANWSISGLYFGPATNNIPTAFNADGTVSSDVACLSSTIQLSDISLTENTAQTYTPTSTPGTPPTVDTNPMISYSDTTMQTSGNADGGIYNGESLNDVQYEYIYTGYDTISFIAPTGANWYFGGGYGSTTLTASSGNNVFLASMSGSLMHGGAGDDTFVIQRANATYKSTTNTITNFHGGDKIVMNGLADAGWTYEWLSGSSTTGGLTLCATNNGLGLTETIILDGLTASAIGQLSLTKVAGTNDLSLSFVAPSSTVVSDLSTEIATYAPSTNRFSFINSSTATLASGVTGAATLNLTTPMKSNTSAADEITNFTTGDKLVIDNLSGPDWTYSFVDQNLSSMINTGLTLVIQNTATDVVDMVTFSQMNSDDLSSLAVSWGGAASNQLTVTHL